LTYEIRWSAAAQKSLVRLPEKVATACVAFVYRGLAENPWRVGKVLRFELEGLHSARRGDYRVVYLTDDKQACITVVAVQHRADVYRPK
jgi:mRNA-degrading endonuclease RelE of RelBE toxin-antitoxin system